MTKGKSLIELAAECERRARNVGSEGDRDQLKQIAAQLKEKEMAARELRAHRPANY
jgi:hypothetical protein